MPTSRIVGFGVCGRNEKRLEQTLKEFQRLCDDTLIVCNNTDEKSKKLIKSYGFHIREDNSEWGKLQWKIKQDGINALADLKPDWVVSLDMDESFDPDMTREDLEELASRGGAGYYTYIINLYDDGYIPNWSFFNIRFWNYAIQKKMEQKSLHCGLAPRDAYLWGNYMPHVLLHYGLKDKEDRDRKVERYKKYDPKADLIKKDYYDMLATQLPTHPFELSKIREQVKEEVQHYHFKEYNRNMEKKKKFVYLRRLADGALLDIPEEQVDETMKRGGFALVTKAEPVAEESTDSSLTCDECGFVAKSEFGLRSHARKHDN